MTTPATFHDGKTAAALGAIPRLEGEFLRVLSPEGNQLAVWEQKHIALAHPNPMPLRLRLEPDSGERLTISDPATANTDWRVLSGTPGQLCIGMGGCF